jgi:AcrR family transcriptional regulator
MEILECPSAAKVDPRIRRTRKLLEDAFRSLVRERPYSEISVGEITERATVNRATFYAHYLDKQDLASSAMTSELHSVLFQALQPPSPFTEENLVRAGAAIFEFFATIRSRCPKVASDLGVKLGSNFQSAIQEFLRNWISRDPRAMNLFPGSQPETVSTVLSWSLYGAAVSWIRQPRGESATQAAAKIISLIATSKKSF